MARRAVPVWAVRVQMNNGVILKKLTMDERLGSFREMKNYRFIYTNEEKE